MNLQNYKNKSYWFIFNNNQLLVIDTIEKIEVPFLYSEDVEKIGLTNILYVGEENKISYYTGNIDSRNNINLISNYKFCDIRELYGNVLDNIFFVAGKAKHLLHWNNNNVYCGKCGNILENKEDERAKKCNKCGNIIYPRISPAIIVAITKDKEILLAHSKHFPEGLYTVIAGFVEIGENLEECVKREIKEEIGIRVKNIKYFESQPWPFPDSLMVGFTAEYESGEISVDGVEIEDAQWFVHNSLPKIPKKYTIARKLIENYIENINCEN
jgi:NAD+ diphosphatase